MFTFNFFSTKVLSQCLPHIVYPASAWTDVGLAGTAYNQFMCQAHDSIFTNGTLWNYFDGDGYWVRLISGSQVTIYVTTCVNNVSLTVVDSTGGIGTGNFIAGAYVAAACPNSLSFTAPYTGTYYVVFDTDNNCASFTTVGEGSVSIKLNNAASYPVCNPLQPSNDTICSATPMTLATSVNGNTINASETDPRDADVISAGFLCSTPNNTLWYVFTPPTTGNYDFNATSPAVGGLDMWIGLFSASSCTSTLTYIDCLTGSAPGLPNTNTVQLSAGVSYYIMIDGYVGATGTFSLELLANTVGVNENEWLSSQLTIYPNPSDGIVTISNTSKSKDVAFSIFGSVGKKVYSGELNAGGSTPVDLTFLSNGIYTVQFRNNEGIYTRRIVIQNQN